MSIISINGKVGSGKDTVGKFIQYLMWKDRVERGIERNFHWTVRDFLEGRAVERASNWKIKKFATKLKQIACMMLGCTMEQLENQEFKASPLPDQWQTEYPLLESDKKTYRWFLQTLGTESTREMIHGNFWINGLFTDYKINNHKEGVTYSTEDFPNWIITDLRFPNELRAIKKHDGITIRVNRKKEDKYYYNADYITLDQLRETIKGETGEYPLYEYCKNYLVAEHESEIALDKATFDFVIDNNGTIEELIEKVREILIEINLIK